MIELGIISQIKGIEIEINFDDRYPLLADSEKIFGYEEVLQPQPVKCDLNFGTELSQAAGETVDEFEERIITAIKKSIRSKISKYTKKYFKETQTYNNLDDLSIDFIFNCITTIDDIIITEDRDSHYLRGYKLEMFLTFNFQIWFRDQEQLNVVKLTCPEFFDGSLR